jgi:hypothetical protein
MKDSSKKMTHTLRQKRIGRTQQKILLMLLTGLALGLSGSPRQYFRILGAFKKDWKILDNTQFSRSIESLLKQGLVKCETRDDGTLDVKLTKKGRLQSLFYEPITNYHFNKEKWDGYWRIVMFDIPREKNNIRDTFRFQLKRLGFVELQQSVFISPYDASEVIDTLSTLHDVFDCVIYIHATSVSNERKLLKHFKLPKTPNR